MTRYLSFKLRHFRPDPALFSRFFHAFFTLFSRSFHSLFTLFSLSFHSLFTLFSLSFHALFTLFSRSFHALFTRSSFVHPSFLLLFSFFSSFSIVSIVRFPQRSGSPRCGAAEMWYNYRIFLRKFAKKEKDPWQKSFWRCPAAWTAASVPTF